MPDSFDVSILSMTEVHTLEGIWLPDVLKTLLELAEADDIGEVADEDLLEISLMALQDLGNQTAGELVLEVVFGESMRPGVRQNLVDDLQEDEPWNDFAEVSQQRGIFVAVCLLHQAFPTRYGTPDALEVEVKVHAQSESGLAELQTGSADWLVRLLAGGMSEDSIVHRLYADELRSGEFSDAPGLIWSCEMHRDDPDDDTTCIFRITASRQLCNSLAAGQSFKTVVA